MMISESGLLCEKVGSKLRDGLGSGMRCIPSMPSINYSACPPQNGRQALALLKVSVDRVC